MEINKEYIINKCECIIKECKKKYTDKNYIMEKINHILKEVQ